MFGYLNIHKPAGVTSRDVVNQVQRLVRPEKVGHAGTLDPLATGVLVICVGRATRLTEYVQRMPKHYSATFLLGRQSDTEDIEGHVIELADPPQPTRDQIEAVLARFLGEIQQVPPAYSALKVDGRRAYDLARRGDDVHLAARPVVIHELRIVAYDYPELRLDIVCGSGTYVRSLGRDIARAVGTEAVMSALVRTAIGNFRLDEACDARDLTAASLPIRLLPARRAVADLPARHLTPAELQRIGHGLPLEPQREIVVARKQEIAAFNEHGELVAILTPRDDGWLRPILNFPATS